MGFLLFWCVCVRDIHLRHNSQRQSQFNVKVLPELINTNSFINGSNGWLIPPHPTLLHFFIHPFIHSFIHSSMAPWGEGVGWFMCNFSASLFLFSRFSCALLLLSRRWVCWKCASSSSCVLVLLVWRRKLKLLLLLLLFQMTFHF
jgi:hypothetical protein